MEHAEGQASRLELARRRVLDIVEREPGLSMSEIARRCDMYWTTVALHIERLRQDDLVASIRVGRRRVLFPRSLLDQVASEGIGLLGEPACRRVALAILQQPRSRVWELCEITGMSERSVYHHVQRLVGAGLVKSDKERAYRGLEADPRLAAIFHLRTADRDHRQPHRLS